MSTTRLSLAIDPVADQRNAIGSEPMVRAAVVAEVVTMGPKLRAKFWACQAQISQRSNSPSRAPRTRVL